MIEIDPDLVMFHFNQNMIGFLQLLGIIGSLTLFFLGTGLYIKHRWEESIDK